MATPPEDNNPPADTLAAMEAQLQQMKGAERDLVAQRKAYIERTDERIKSIKAERVRLGSEVSRLRQHVAQRVHRSDGTPAPITEKHAL